MPRLTSLITALLLLASVQVLAQAASPADTLKVSAANTIPAVPGKYVTLMFSAEGSGDYTFEADSDPDWVPVTRTRTVKLSGRTLLPVTFKVPALAAVGQSPPLVLRAMHNGTEVSRAQGFVQVQPHAKLRLTSPARLNATTSHPVVVPLEITNLGNQIDTVTLRITNLDRSGQLTQQQVTLKPGESRTVNATLKLERVSPNFLYILFFEAVSSFSPGVTASARTETVFNTVGVEGDTSAAGPTLSLGLDSNLNATAQWTPEGRTVTVHYSVRPVVSGTLSDYVNGQADLSGLEGTEQQPLPRGVNFGVGLTAERWAATLNVGTRGFSVSGNLKWHDWLLSSNARYQTLPSGQTIGVGIGASTTLAGGQLTLDAGTTLTSAADARRRADNFGISYARTFAGRWAANASLRATGTQVDNAYTTTLSVSQQLSYNAQAFDVTQSYFASLGGLQVLGLSGGLRSTQPFGVRGAVSLLIQPAGLTATASGLLIYSAPYGVGLSLSGRVVGGNIPDRPVDWQTTLSASAPPLHLGSVSLLVAGAYTLATDHQTPVIHAPGQLTHDVNLDATVLGGSLQSKTSLNWQRGAGGDQRLRLGVSGAYLWKANTFSAQYTLEKQRKDQLSTQLAEASWSREWTSRVSSTVSYSRGWSSQSSEAAPARATAGSQSLGISIGVQDVGLPGLRLSAGYRLINPLGGATVSQAISLGLGYNLDARIATPSALLNFFGGRKGGKVHGVLFQDDNLNGVQDANEPGLAGVRLQIGPVEAVSDAHGAYQLQVPAGTYTPHFTAGLPATVEAVGLKPIVVKENADILTPVAFAPVAAVNVLIFNDLNLNGVQDEGEAPLPYASVNVSGPLSRTIQGDARGYVRLSGLIKGEYQLTLPAEGLPPGFEPSRPSWSLTVQPGHPVTDLQLGAAQPARKITITYTAGSLTVLGSFSQDEVVRPGGSATLKLQLRGVQTITISAFGQGFTLKPDGTSLSQTIAVPSGTAPGLYDVTVLASGDGGTKTFTYKLLVQAPEPTSDAAPAPGPP